MRSACVLLAPMLIACFVPDISRAGEGAVASRASAEAAGALLYLDRAAWQRADPVQRTTLATDFMRIYCGNPAMPPADLVACLDSFTGAGAMFETALSCVAGGAQGAGAVGR